MAAVYEAWNEILWEYEPYTSDQLSILFDLILEEYSEYPYWLSTGQEYILKFEDFSFIRDTNGKVRVEFWQFKNATSNDIFRGLMTDFDKLPLLMHGATKMTQIMIKWRLLIGR